MNIKRGIFMVLLSFENLKSQNGVRQCISRKESRKPLEFSLATHTEKSKNRVDAVLKNRKYIEQFFSQKSSFVSVSQVHGDEVYVVKEKRDINWQTSSERIEADSLITNIPEVVLTVLTADCPPILLFDLKERAVGAVHSGWRGTEKSIVKRTVESMYREYATESENLVVGIGPSIRGCCYEVGGEVAERFKSYPSAVKKEGDRYFLDVATVCKKQLLSLGVKRESIETIPICTSCDKENFFSYRRDKCSGRFMSCISLDF
jgi:YfiH family protein